MTSPIGKILLAKLPKDIIQFCIEPYLMMSEEEVEKYRQNMIREFKSHPANFYNRMLATMSFFTPKAEDRVVIYRKSQKKNSELVAMVAQLEKAFPPRLRARNRNMNAFVLANFEAIQVLMIQRDMELQVLNEITQNAGF
jgi:hypothetical protein